MNIKSVTFDLHAILGSSIIDFTDGKTYVNPNDFKDHGIKITIGSEKQNQFTYIIGPNGVGKTVFFRTLINYMNLNSSKEDERLEQYISLFPLSKEYERFRSEKAADAELQSYSVYNKKGEDLLSNEKAYLIYITSAMGGTPIHKNARYRSFNYLSDINKTKSLLIRALNRLDQETQNRLNVLIGRPENSVWKVTGKLMNSGDRRGKGDKSEWYEFELADRSVNIRQLLAVLKKIRLVNNKFIDIQDWKDWEINAFKSLYNDSTFFKFFFDSGLTLSRFIIKLKQSLIFETILNLFNETIVSNDSELPLIRIKQKDASKWDNLFSDVNKFEPFDCELLIVLENLKLIDIFVTCNKLPVHLMSSGEQTMLRLFSFFADLPVKSRNRNLLVFFDEPENTLHPKWQQKFHIDLNELVTKIYKIKSSHFLISTHSPLIIMKTDGQENTGVIQFFHNDNGEFESRAVKDINAYSIEEVMLDEFNISYRDKALEIEYNKLLETKSKDPILSIRTSFDLRDQIQAMFDDLGKS